MTFIEVVVSITLLAMIVMAVMGAMIATAKGSAVHRTLADSQVWVAAAADEIRGFNVDYVPCATPGDYLVGHVPAQAEQPEIDVDVVVESVRFWDGSSWESSCPDDQSLQLVTVSATAGETTSTVGVVKRAPLNPSRFVYVSDGSSADPSNPGDPGGGGGTGPTISIVPTPGINGETPATTSPPATTTTTTSPGATTTTTTPTTTVPGATTTTPATTTTTTTTTTTAPPGGGPTCAVTGISTNQYWLDTISVSVTNSTSQSYTWQQWSVRLTYSGSGSEPNNHYTSTWNAGTLTLRPAHSWLGLNANSTRNLEVREPGGSMIGVAPASIGCVVAP